MSKSRRMPTQQDVRDQGECGHGFNYGGPGGRPRYCGEPSEPGATFGDCTEHARQFREQIRDTDRAVPGYQSTCRLELGDRVAEADYWENLGRSRDDWAEALVRKDTVRQRGLAALERREERAARPRTNRRRPR